MSVAAFAISQASVSQVQAAPPNGKTPPPRMIIAFADQKPAPESR